MTPRTSILFVDHNADHVALAVEALYEYGLDVVWHRVDCERDYITALTRTPDLIIADHQVHGFGTTDALALLIERGLDIPLIVSSRTLAAHQVIELLRTGARDFIPKHDLSRLGPVVERELHDSAARRAQHSSKLLLQRLHLAVDSTDDCLVVVDRGAQITFANRAAAARFRRPETQLIGHDLRLMVGADEYATVFAAKLERALDGESVEFEFEQDPCGTPCVLHGVMSPLRDDPTRVSGAVIVMRNVTEQKCTERELEALATKDSLTGLPNRRVFRAEVATAIERCIAGGDQVAVLMFDVDRFKEINDSLGHAAGDQALIAIAGTLRRCVPEGAMIARLGGDEFAMLVTCAEAQVCAERAAATLAAALKTPLRCGEREHQLGVSIGIALAPADALNVEDMLRKADLAMYTAKRERRGSTRYSAKLSHDLDQRLRLEHDLRHAIARDQLRLRFQPVVELSSGRTIGAEALLRWTHPELGDIAPARFIPVAESSGLIVPIGEWVLEHACRQAVAWRRAGLPPLRMAVNVAPQQLRESGFAARVAATLAATGLPGDALEIEITEGTLLENDRATLQSLAAVRAQGISVALDDFGTGWSSLSYLGRMPIDRIKIDRSFVKELPASVESAAIVRAVLAMAEGLGLTTVAEGIETPAQLEFLCAAGCPDGQGYLFARPLESAAFAAQFEQRAAA